MVISEIKLRPKTEVARDFAVSTRSIDRWVQNPALGFPVPVKINSRCYFDRDALEKWKTARIRELAAGQSALAT